MMKLIEYRYFNFTLHALIWSIIFFLPYLVSDAANEYKIGPLPGYFFTFSVIVHIAIFYVNALVLYPKLLNRTWWWLYIVSVILLILFSFRVKLYVLTTWFPYCLPTARSHVFFPSLLAFAVSVFYSRALDTIRAEKEKKKKEAAQLEMELKFLRSQISPHFLFNILTNLVSLARKKSDHLESSLLMLSGLMRYMLYDAGKKIALQQEAEYLESYITLQKLRFGQDVKITSGIALPQEEKTWPIEPMLLIPFVENAFKHGTGYVHEPFIDIHLTAGNGLLVFRVKNRFGQEAEGSKDESSGIGLSNVRSRLTLLYPGKHDLVINTGNNLFTIHLTLKLS